MSHFAPLVRVTLAYAIDVACRLNSQGILPVPSILVVARVAIGYQPQSTETVVPADLVSTRWRFPFEQPSTEGSSVLTKEMAALTWSRHVAENVHA